MLGRFGTCVGGAVRIGYPTWCAMVLIGPEPQADLQGSNLGLF